MIKRFAYVLLPVLLIGFLAGCIPQRVSIKQFHKQDSSSEAVLKLRGMGIKNLLMLRAFMAALYLPADIKSEDALLDVPKDLEVHYYLRVPSGAISQYTIDRMKMNISPEDFKTVEPFFDKMREYFPDIHSGDVLSLSYMPGKGTRFIYNGKLRGVIEGKDFAKAIFSTWVGSNPFDMTLKAQILGLDPQRRR